MASDIGPYLKIRACTAPVLVDGGESVAFLSSLTGDPQLWLTPVGGGFPEQLSSGVDRVGSMVTDRGGRHLAVACDIGGDERWDLYLARPWRPLVTGGGIHALGAFAPDGSALAYTDTTRNGTDFDLAIVDVETGVARACAQLEGSNFVVAWHENGVLLLRAHSNLAHELFWVDPDSGMAAALLDDGRADRFESPILDTDGSVLAGCDRNAEFARLVRVDGGKIEVIDDDHADVEHLARADRSTVVVRNLAGYSRLEVGGVPVRDLPDGVVTGIATAHASGQIVVSAVAPDDTEDLYAIERGLARRLTRSFLGGLERSGLVRPVLQSFASFDGLDVPYWLYGPSEAPTVCHVHGGPESQARPALNGVIQFLVAQGISVAVPNVRGSTGYGRTYTHLDDVEKRLDSVTDLAELARLLGAERGVPVGVIGGSYGGYMTLAAITEHPGLWRAAVSIVGIANFVTFLERTGSYRRKLREAEYGSLEHDRAFLERISPIGKIDRIVTPLMVIHGANDPRVPVGEAEQIVSALRGRGREVVYLRYEDEGHGLVKLANRLDAYPQVADFLTGHLLRAGWPLDRSTAGPV